eukprot:967863-Pelagomonas_calceolata.AAC.4
MQKKWFKWIKVRSAALMKSTALSGPWPLDLLLAQHSFLGFPTGARHTAPARGHAKRVRPSI